MPRSWLSADDQHLPADRQVFPTGFGSSFRVWAVEPLYRAVVDIQVDDRVPVDEAKKKARAVVPLPPMQRKRGAGRAARTAAERQDWTAQFKAQVQSPTPPDQARRQRVRLARTHRRRRRRQKVLAPLTRLKLWKRALDTTPGRTEPTARATTP